MVEVFDREALETEAGVRALWLLYKWGRWDYLEDFGLDRAEAEGAFVAFDAENITENRPGRHPLTRKQCRVLLGQVPGLAEAGKELRLAYALLFFDERTIKGVRNEDVHRGS